MAISRYFKYKFKYILYIQISFEYFKYIKTYLYIFS